MHGSSFFLNQRNLSKESVDEITSTLRACADERVTDQEQRYLAALQSAGRYELDGNILQLLYDDGAGVLIFETALPAGPGGPLPAVESATPGG